MARVSASRLVHGSPRREVARERQAVPTRRCSRRPWPRRRPSSARRRLNSASIRASTSALVAAMSALASREARAKPRANPFRKARSFVSMLSPNDPRSVLEAARLEVDAPAAPRWQLAGRRQRRRLAALDRDQRAGDLLANGHAAPMLTLQARPRRPDVIRHGRITHMDELPTRGEVICVPMRRVAPLLCSTLRSATQLSAA